MGEKPSKSRKPSGTNAERLLESTVFFVDRCLGRKIVEALRAEGLRVESHEDHFDDSAEDTHWIKKVGSKKWVALTKDSKIAKKQHERRAVIDANLRIFTLSNANLTGDQMIELFKKNLRNIGRFLNKHEAPFIACVYDDTVKIIPFPKDSPDS